MIDIDKVVSGINYNGNPMELAGGTTPTGTIDITENGTYDVTEYASADVNVSSGTEITDGIVFNAKDADGHPTEVTFYGAIPQNAMGYYNASTYCLGVSLTTVHFDASCKSMGYGALQRTAITDLNIPDHIDSIGGSILRGHSQTIKSLVHENCRNGYGYRGWCVDCLYQMGISETAQFGAIGKPMTANYYQAWSQAFGASCVITVYCTGDNVDDFLSNFRRQYVTTQTIVFKASEDTTYGGTAYAAGETMLTSEVA